MTVTPDTRIAKQKDTGKMKHYRQLRVSMQTASRVTSKFLQKRTIHHA